MSVRVIVLGVLLWLCMPLFSMNLMQAQVVVADQSAASLDKALPGALAQVLVKVSGNPSVMTLPTINNQLAHVRDIVQSYAYQTITPTPGQSPQLVVNILFDKKAIAQLLTMAGQPMWGSDRPKTLVWLEEGSGAQSEVIASTDVQRNPLAQAIVHDAQLRGLKLIFPIDDLDDQNNFVLTNDGLFNTEQIEKASKRYGVRSILVGRVTQFQGTWQVRWKYVLDSAPVEWQDKANSIDPLAKGVIDWVSGTMVSQLAMANPDMPEQSVVLRISGITNLAQYTQVQKLLMGLTPVTHVGLERVSANVMMLTVSYTGSEQGLEQAIIQSHQLTPDVHLTSTFAEQPTVAVLNYVWQGVVS